MSRVRDETQAVGNQTVDQLHEGKCEIEANKEGGTKSEWIVLGGEERMRMRKMGKVEVDVPEESKDLLGVLVISYVVIK